MALYSVCIPFKYYGYETLYTNDDDDIYRRCSKQQSNEISTSVSFLYLSFRIDIKSYSLKERAINGTYKNKEIDVTNI